MSDNNKEANNAEANIKKPRKEYVTKQQREQFIKWYLDKYGYNVNLKKNNSRVLSDTYLAERGIYIPKITIYRWLGKMHANEDNIEEKVNDFSSEYIVAEFR